MKKTTIFIADDHPVLRNGIKAILAGSPDYEVIGEADDGLQALSGIASLKPDIVMMDITMPGLNGIMATKRALEDFPDLKVIILSMHGDVVHAIDAFRAGALGYVLKESATQELIQAVEKVKAGTKYASPAVAEELLNDIVDVIKKEQSHDPFDLLSHREKEILKFIADGSTSREIADKLFISISTVKSHRNNIMKKLKVNDMANLIKIAIRKGIVKPE
ncbi:MAG: response regulator transcription factor [Deltaproteobacteria bacterium]|nr:response regulator transcription factor [Deltaproteobacteria bacterium]